LDTIKQRRLRNVAAYITGFQKLCHDSNFDENALMFMFLKGLHPQIHKKFALMNPNPSSLSHLISSSIIVDN